MFSGQSWRTEILSQAVYKADVPVFGDQNGRGVGRVETKRRLPFFVARLGEIVDKTFWAIVCRNMRFLAVVFPT